MVGLVGFECAAAHLRPTACRRGDRSLLGELIQKISAFAGLEKALASDRFSTGWEFLVMNQHPRSAVFRGQRLATVVLL